MKSVKNWKAYMRGSRAIGRQDFVAAATTYEQVLIEDPHDGMATAMLARCYAALGRTREALDLAEQALLQIPDSFVMLQLAAGLCVQLGEHTRARQLVERAFALDPRKHAVSEPLRWLLYHLARTPGIRRLFNPERVPELEPGRHEREIQEWKRWAEQYLASGTGGPA